MIKVEYTTFNLDHKKNQNIEQLLNYDNTGIFHHHTEDVTPWSVTEPVGIGKVQHTPSVTISTKKKEPIKKW